MVLEHLLEHRFSWTIKRLAKEVAGSQGGDIVDVLAYCWPFGDEAERRWSEVQALLATQGRSSGWPFTDAEPAES
ncbi:MAG: hypothetical protein KF774_19240 [Planctomyces sp.]|nr:hypothetical protein [Planctomyces sp.]